MPLHTIPLCTMRYVGDIYSSATFKYDTAEKISKTKNKLIYKKSYYEIEKANEKLFYKYPAVIDKSKEKLLHLNPTTINKSKNFNLNINTREIVKELDKNLDSNNLEINKLESKNILNTTERELTKNKIKQIGSIEDINIKKTNVKELEITKLSELNKFNFKNISRENFIKDININSNLMLDRLILKDLEKNKNLYFIDRFKDKSLDVISSVIELERLNKHEADKTINKLLLDIYKIKNLNKSTSNNFYDRDNLKFININNFNYFTYRYNIKNLNKELYTQLMYKDIERLIDVDNSKKLLKKVNAIPITNNVELKLAYKQGAYKINKSVDISLGHEYLRRIMKNNSVALNKELFRRIIKNTEKALNDVTVRKIYSSIDLYGLNKSYINIYNPNALHGLNKFYVDIYKPSKEFGLNKEIIRNIYNPYDTWDLEVIKRWWVLRATSPTDNKILPFDYNYSKNPLPVNSRIKPYGYLIDQDKHPISYMPYLESRKGIDLYYGLDEIPVSIEIMLDMTNIVGMIVQHSASQFANASGQEAIEFIMEVLLDWLNLDSTVKEMNLKGSREHYLRAYRWIRWEAEKVWFAADQDHSIAKMSGIKYAGMLFSNLLDYLKYHHFNVVPLWRNLKFMDIERQFNRQAVNGDLMKDLDKIKGKRHYFIETQNFERKNIFGNLK